MPCPHVDVLIEDQHMNLEECTIKKVLMPGINRFLRPDDVPKELKGIQRLCAKLKKKVF